MKTIKCIFLLIFLLSANAFSSTQVFNSDGYLKAAEMNIGDTLIYKLKNGQSRQFILAETSAKPLFVFSNPDNSLHSGTVYSMDCKIIADGQELSLKKIVPAQQSYYEPWHINGVTFFFDAVKAIEEFIKDSHGSTGGSAYPKKDARFAFIEYRDDFSIQPLMPWYPNKRNCLSIKNAYHGGDCWLGAYQKTEAHNGLDVNIPNNTALRAPIDFDTQYYFNSLAQGDKNNRWMGVRKWPNGEKWTLRTHHMTALQVEQKTAVKQGLQYGTVGGVHFGEYPHIHFYFIWEKDDISLALDPWMIFWKIFENNKKRAGQLRAVMKPLNPVKEGERVILDASASSGGIYGPALQYFWTVNDGALYEGVEAEHVFIKEGVHVVTLTVTNGTDTATINQHITVNRGTPPDNYLRLRTEDPFDFRRRTSDATEIYAYEDNASRNTIRFFFRKESDYSPLAKEVILEGSNSVLQSIDAQIEYIDYSDWLRIEKKDNIIRIELMKEHLSKAKGSYRAKIHLSSESTGIHQSFPVVATAPDHRYQPAERIVVDDKEAEFYPSNYHWIEEAYDYDFLKGHGSVSFWAGCNGHHGIARYQPELSGGKYRICLHEDAIYEPGYSETKSGVLHVRVKTVKGIADILWDPKESNTIGSFELLGGKDSYLDILTNGSTGQIYLDAMVFEKIE